MTDIESVSLLPPPPVQNISSGTATNDHCKPMYGATNQSAAEVTKEPLNDKELLFSSFCKQHHRDTSRESGFETDYAQRSRSASFSSEGEDTDPSSEWGTRSVELVRYMDEHVSKVELELREITLEEREEANDEDEVLDMNSTVLTTNSIEDDFETINISSEYVSVEEERKHCRSAFGLLYNLKLEILRLKGHLDSECTKLDRIVMGADSVSDNTMQSQRLVLENSLKQGRFQDRLDVYLEEVGERMNTIRHKNDIIINGVRANRKHSESTINKMIRMSPVDCATWLHALLILSLLGIISFMYLWSRSSEQWTVYLRFVRSPVLVVMLLYLYGINMKVWAKFRIDYAAIFDYRPNGIPTPKYIFKVAAVLTVMVTILMIIVMVASPFSSRLPIKIIPPIMWVLLLAFLLNPFNVFKRKLRFNLILAFVRVLLSPFVFVFFSDFFLADQFTSTVAIFLDVQYIICYLTADSLSAQVDTKVCTSSGNGIRPIISLLPCFWRFLQCLRCFYDTHNVLHLVNAGKYFTTLPLVLFATFFSTHVKGDIMNNFNFNRTGWILVCLVAASFVHSLYTFLWDVCCDWGLWNLRCSFFRRKLIYRRKAVYVLVIMVDFVLRFFWAVKITMALVWQKDSDLIYTGLVLAEIIRRFIWNFFRVEHAHVLSEEEED